MKYLAWALVIALLGGCTVRILTFGTEESHTDRKYSLGYSKATKGEKDD